MILKRDHLLSHLKSAECPKVRRVYSFAILEARYVTRLRRRNAHALVPATSHVASVSRRRLL